MIRHDIGDGYTENIVEPFPELMLGRHERFRHLPYLSPEYVPLLTKERMLTANRQAMAQAQSRAAHAAPERQGGAVVTETA
ncbi:MAG: hypothetical protein AB7E47_01005 [Desulfovibrionaceae bacterium]